MSAPANSVPGQRKPFGGRWAYAVLVVALLFVLMPFLFWRATWFGRPLTDEQLQKALTDSQHPREIQHALSLIADRIRRGDPTVQRWYPDVVRLAASNSDQIRPMVAWVMGQDNSVPAFHEALLKLLTDPQPMVQRNAALSLVRFHDTAGRSIIVSMLRPYALPALEAGVLKERLKPADVVNTDTLVGNIWVAGQKREVRSAVPGTIDRWLVPDGASVTAGQGILALAPSQQMVWEALRALFLIGLPEDLPEVDRYARGVEGRPREIQQQATETSRAIRARQP